MLLALCLVVVFTGKSERIVYSAIFVAIQACLFLGALVYMETNH